MSSGVVLFVERDSGVDDVKDDRMPEQLKESGYVMIDTDVIDPVALSQI